MAVGRVLPVGMRAVGRWWRGVRVHVAGAQGRRPGAAGRATGTSAGRGPHTDGRITADKAPSSCARQDRPGAAGPQRRPARPGRDQARLRRRRRLRRRGGGVRGTSPLVTGVPLSERPAAAASATSATSRHRRRRSSTPCGPRCPSAEIGTSLRTVYGGISAVIPANAVEDVLAIPGVVAVQTERPAPAADRLQPEFVDADHALRRARHDRERRRGPHPRQPRHRRLAGAPVVRGPGQPAGTGGPGPRRATSATTR